LNDDLRALINSRLKQANESIEEARVLSKENISLRGVVNRLYYAMFYAVLALLQERNLGTAKHAGVISLFDKEFVKTDLFDKTMSHALHRGFEMRQKGDYMEQSTLSREEVDDLFQAAVGFVHQVHQYFTDR
jgi:uncharacterized protein